MMNDQITPAVFVLDDRGSLVSCTAGDQFAWQDLEEQVVQLLDEVRLSGEATSSTAHDDTLHVAPLTTTAFVAVVTRRHIDDPIARLAARYHLTRRECAVLRALAGGATTTEIAERLSIAPSTVVMHVKRILAKTDAPTRAAILGRVLDEAVGVTTSPV